MKTKLICVILLLTFALSNVVISAAMHGKEMKVNFWTQVFACIVKVLLYAGIGAFSL